MEQDTRDLKIEKYVDSLKIKSKLCLNCGTEIFAIDYFTNLPKNVSGPNQFAIFWEQKKYCDKNCRVAFTNRTDIRFTNKCIHCGKNFHKRGNESIRNFNNKKFCTNECKYEYYLILRLARKMKITYDQLKKVLIKNFG